MDKLLLPYARNRSRSTILSRSSSFTNKPSNASSEILDVSASQMRIPERSFHSLILTGASSRRATTSGSRYVSTPGQPSKTPAHGAKQAGLLKRFMGVPKDIAEESATDASQAHLTAVDEPVGCVAFHIKHCKDFSNTLVLKKRMQLVIRINVGNIMKCTAPHHIRELLKIKKSKILIPFEEVKYFCVQVPRGKNDDRNKISIELLGLERLSESQRLLGRTYLHLFDIVQHVSVTDSFELGIKNLHVCNLDMSIDFAYGYFGYGFSNQLKQPENEKQKIQEKSLFLRIPPLENRKDNVHNVITYQPMPYPAFLPDDLQVTVGRDRERESVLTETSEELKKVPRKVLQLMKSRKRLDQLRFEYNEKKTEEQRIEFLEQLILKKVGKSRKMLRSERKMKGAVWAGPGERSSSPKTPLESTNNYGMIHPEIEVIDVDSNGDKEHTSELQDLVDHLADMPSVKGTTDQRLAALSRSTSRRNPISPFTSKPDSIEEEASYFSPINIASVVSLHKPFAKFLNLIHRFSNKVLGVAEEPQVVDDTANLESVPGTPDASEERQEQDLETTLAAPSPESDLPSPETTKPESEKQDMLALKQLDGESASRSMPSMYSYPTIDPSKNGSDLSSILRKDGKFPHDSNVQELNISFLTSSHPVPLQTPVTLQDTSRTDTDMQSKLPEAVPPLEFSSPDTTSPDSEQDNLKQNRRAEELHTENITQSMPSMHSYPIFESSKTSPNLPSTLRREENAFLRSTEAEEATTSFLTASHPVPLHTVDFGASEKSLGFPEIGKQEVSGDDEARRHEPSMEFEDTTPQPIKVKSSEIGSQLPKTTSQEDGQQKGVPDSAESLELYMSSLTTSLIDKERRSETMWSNNLEGDRLLKTSPGQDSDVEFIETPKLSTTHLGSLTHSEIPKYMPYWHDGNLQQLQELDSMYKPEKLTERSRRTSLFASVSEDDRIHMRGPGKDTMSMISDALTFPLDYLADTEFDNNMTNSRKRELEEDQAQESDFQKHFFKHKASLPRSRRTSVFASVSEDDRIHMRGPGIDTTSMISDASTFQLDYLADTEFDNNMTNSRKRELEEDQAQESDFQKHFFKHKASLPKYFAGPDYELDSERLPMADVTGEESLRAATVPVYVVDTEIPESWNRPLEMQSAMVPDVKAEESGQEDSDNIEKMLDPETPVPAPITSWDRDRDSEKPRKTPLYLIDTDFPETWTKPLEIQNGKDLVEIESFPPDQQNIPVTQRFSDSWTSQDLTSPVPFDESEDEQDENVEPATTFFTLQKRAESDQKPASTTATSSVTTLLSSESDSDMDNMKAFSGYKRNAGQSRGSRPKDRHSIVSQIFTDSESDVDETSDHPPVAAIQQEKKNQADVSLQQDEPATSRQNALSDTELTTEREFIMSLASYQKYAGRHQSSYSKQSSSIASFLSLSSDSDKDITAENHIDASDSQKLLTAADRKPQLKTEEDEIYSSSKSDLLSDEATDISIPFTGELLPPEISLFMDTNEDSDQLEEHYSAIKISESSPSKSESDSEHEVKGTTSSSFMGYQKPRGRSLTTAWPISVSLHTLEVKQDEEKRNEVRRHSVETLYVSDSRSTLQTEMDAAENKQTLGHKKYSGRRHEVNLSKVSPSMQSFMSPQNDTEQDTFAGILTLLSARKRFSQMKGSRLSSGATSEAETKHDPAKKISKLGPVSQRSSKLKQPSGSSSSEDGGERDATSKYSKLGAASQKYISRQPSSELLKVSPSIEAFMNPQNDVEKDKTAGTSMDEHAGV
ncbi:uncharacterized protein LOC119959010 [Scyliorhinus canicula]|uniref:uncharacterized protein LOC119959010 n=1 Tax=Scyliorhinus canicula TaxID=7830 RepID=UPI0018F7BB97|nr:uncharacterized protein LOC119959010 [Scyliorhinus canicula]